MQRFAKPWTSVWLISGPVWASIFSLGLAINIDPVCIFSTHICSPLHLLSPFGVRLAGITFCKT